MSGRDEARRLLAANVDPSAKRKAEKAARADTFEAIAREFLDLKANSLSPRTQQKKLARFEAFVCPHFGTQPIAAITAPQLLAALRRIEERGKHETAHRVRAECGAVFRYAIATPLPTFAARSRPWSFAIIQRSLSRRRSAS